MEPYKLDCLTRVLNPYTISVLVVLGVGGAIIYFSKLTMKEPTPRVNKPIPRLAQELSVLPEVETAGKLQDEDDSEPTTGDRYEIWCIFKHHRPCQLEKYTTIAGIPLLKTFRAGYTEWLVYEIPATQHDIRSRLELEEKADLENGLRRMDPLALAEIQWRLESKRLAGRDGRSVNDVAEVVMLKCIGGPSAAEGDAPVQKSRWVYLRSFKQRPILKKEVEYVAIVRMRRARKPSAWKQPRNLNFGSGWIGWQMMGSHPRCYERTVELLGETGVCVLFESKPGLAPKEGFGAMAQIVNAYNYRTKQVKMSAYVKSEAVEHWAGLWMRVDGPDGELHSFDNMEDRAIKGTTDWERYEIVLPVYEESFEIFFGILLDGGGKLWLRDFQLEVEE